MTIAFKRDWFKQKKLLAPTPVITIKTVFIYLVYNTVFPP
jgi:hypothetical protein